MAETLVDQRKLDGLDLGEVLYLKIHALRYEEIADDLTQIVHTETMEIQLMVMGEVLYAKKNQDGLVLEGIHQIKIHVTIYVEME